MAGRMAGLPQPQPASVVVCGRHAPASPTEPAQGLIRFFIIGAGVLYFSLIERRTVKLVAQVVMVRVAMDLMVSQRRGQHTPLVADGLTWPLLCTAFGLLVIATLFLVVAVTLL